MTKHSRNPVTLKLSADEALVLLEWLARTSTARTPAPFDDKAEQIVLWNVECMLESALWEPSSAEYGSLLDAARSAIRGEAAE